MQQRIIWEDLPEDTRTAIQARTGPIEQACAVSEGTNSALAAVLHSCTGWVFIKGIRTDHASVAAKQREAAINPHVRTLAPAVLWHLDDVAGWNVLGFEHIEGRHRRTSAASEWGGKPNTTAAADLGGDGRVGGDDCQSWRLGRVVTVVVSVGVWSSVS